MSTQHTAGPWAQGTTLTTPQTDRWSAKEWEANQRRERLMVFANFSFGDQGRSRRLIARCETEEDAQLIACAPELLQVVALYCLGQAHVEAAKGSTLELARAALDKATRSKA